MVRREWPRGLRHGLSSLARILGPWVRIPLEALMFVCVYSVFAVLCVGRDRLCGLVVRVLGCRSGGPGSIPDTTKKK
jgi:hypothetical protein